MHISPLILLALANLALTLPTNNTVDASLIEKRSSRPWMDYFDDDDGSCLSREGGDADESFVFIEASKCQVFSPATGRIGGSWGSGTFSISSFWAFENDDCTGAVKQTISRKQGENGFCFTSKCQGGEDLDNPCYYNSVRGNW